MYVNVSHNGMYDLHARLMACSHGRENDGVLACMIASWQSGIGALPEMMGLQEDQYLGLFEFHFPGFEVDCLSGSELRSDPVRMDECEEVKQLLLTHRKGESDSETWMAELVALACQGQDHLWQDMGLWSRKDLSELLLRNYPALATRNDKDMKWKKFIYKQLCITEGIYTCRSPSCEVCAEYNECFGPED